MVFQNLNNHFSKQNKQICTTSKSLAKAKSQGSIINNFMPKQMKKKLKIATKLNQD
jgi:hypothetical protein